MARTAHRLLVRAPSRAVARSVPAPAAVPAPSGRRLRVLMSPLLAIGLSAADATPVPPVPPAPPPGDGAAGALDGPPAPGPAGPPLATPFDDQGRTPSGAPPDGVVDQLNPAGGMRILGREDGPGRVPPVAPAPCLAVEFSWPQYQTLVVIGGGSGIRRPAWIVTWQVAETAGWLRDAGNAVLGLAHLAIEEPQPTLAVAYRAVAGTDAAGTIHLDARAAWKAGDLQDQWSPDSFAIHLPGAAAGDGGDRDAVPGQVETMDDQGHEDRGDVTRVVDPATDGKEYERLKAIAQALVGGGI